MTMTPPRTVPLATAGFKAVRRAILFAVLLPILLAGVCASGCRRSPVGFPTEDSPIIIALGDSITAGNTLEKEQHYPDLIQARFIEDGINARLYNAGFPGDASANAKKRASELLAFKPAMIIIAIGTNDITSATTPEQAEANLAAAIEAMRDAGVDVFLIGSQVERAGQVGPLYRARLDAYAAMYRRLEARFNVPLVLDILAPATNNAERILNDNIHPTAAGQIAIAEMLYEPIKTAALGLIEKRR